MTDGRTCHVTWENRTKHGGLHAAYQRCREHERVTRGHLVTERASRYCEMDAGKFKTISLLRQTLERHSLFHKVFH